MEEVKTMVDMNAEYEDYCLTKTFFVQVTLGGDPITSFGLSQRDLFTRRFGPQNSWSIDVILDIYNTSISSPSDDESNKGDIEALSDAKGSGNSLRFLRGEFNSDLQLNGSVSIEFASDFGEILLSKSTPMISGRSACVSFSDPRLGMEFSRILVTVRVASSSRPAGHPPYSPLQVTDLISRLLNGDPIQDVRFVLYRRIPSADATSQHLGHVYANKRFLSLKCEYFKNGMRFLSSCYAME